MWPLPDGVNRGRRWGRRDIHSTCRPPYSPRLWHEAGREAAPPLSSPCHWCAVSRRCASGVVTTPPSRPASRRLANRRPLPAVDPIASNAPSSTSIETETPTTESSDESEATVTEPTGTGPIDKIDPGSIDSVSSLRSTSPSPIWRRAPERRPRRRSRSCRRPSSCGPTRVSGAHSTGWSTCRSKSTAR